MHYTVTPATLLKEGDYLYIRDGWREIFAITEDSGIRLENGLTICRSELHDQEFSTERLDEWQTAGWSFDYDPSTRFVGATHKKGGKQSLLEMKHPTADTRNYFGSLIACLLNSPTKKENAKKVVMMPLTSCALCTLIRYELSASCSVTQNILKDTTIVDPSCPLTDAP